MAAQPFPRTEIAAFLNRLEEQARAIQAVAQEWETAAKIWPGPEGDQPSKDRFREWFLLERSSEALGAPPLLALAPVPEEEDSPWTKMFAAYLGIFQALGPDDTGMPTFEDLWSGRQIRLDQELPGTQDGILLYGFVVEVDEAHHAPLPGSCLLAGGKLSDALAGDLSRIRVEQPGGRLSLRSCEEFLQFALQGQSHQEAAAESLERALEILFAEVPQWDPQRLQLEIQQNGIAATMNRLAFETDIDLEELRQLLAQESSSTQEESAAAPAEFSPQVSEEAIQVDVQHALDSFDQILNQQHNLDEAFRTLERELGLEEGASSVDPEEQILLQKEPDATADMGPEQVPGMNFWLDCVRWERRQGLAPQDGVNESIEEAWLQHLAATHDGELEPQDIGQQEALSFLVQATNPEEVTSRLQGLKPFLLWLHQEQEAPLPNWLIQSDQDAPEWLRLQAVVACNQAGRRKDWQPEAMAVIANTHPLQVQAEDDVANVKGMDPSWSEHIAIGDHVSGRWRQGHFEALLWLPAAWMPERQESASPSLLRPIIYIMLSRGGGGGLERP